MDRNEMLLSKEVCDSIKTKTVLICGVGGVGGFAAESIARLGAGSIILIDKDVVEKSNKNRQIIALDSTIGKSKVDVMKNRIIDINKECKVIAINDFFDRRLYSMLKNYRIDYVIDAIDTLSPKWELIKFCLDNNIPFVSCLGMGKKLNPMKVTITTLNKTEIDPVAKKIREFARKDRIDLKKIKVVFSSEVPAKDVVKEEGETIKDKNPISSSVFVPAYAGILCGYEFLNYVKSQFSFKEVEIKSYLLNLLTEGKQFEVCFKETLVKAEKGKEGEKIQTIMEDGLIETERIVNKGDWIVTFSSGEKIVVTEDYFTSNYEKTNKKDMYLSKNNIRSALQVDENICFETQKGKMYLKKGGYLIFIDSNDVYAIQENRFNETYKKL